MTVRELVDLLGNYHDESLVLVDGYEGGLDPLVVTERRVVRTPDEPPYYGEWDVDNERGAPAVVLSRTKEHG